MTKSTTDAQPSDDAPEEAAAPQATEAPAAIEAPADEAPAGAPPAAEPAVAATTPPSETGPHYYSIVAFALGLAGLLSPGLGSVAAIVLGHIGLAKEPTGRTFAIIGLVTGYAVCGIFIIGMVLLIAFWGVLISSFAIAMPWEAMQGRFGR